MMFEGMDMSKEYSEAKLAAFEGLWREEISINRIECNES